MMCMGGFSRELISDLFDVFFDDTHFLVNLLRGDAGAECFLAAIQQPIHFFLKKIIVFKNKGTDILLGREGFRLTAWLTAWLEEEVKLLSALPAIASPHQLRHLREITILLPIFVKLHALRNHEGVYEVDFNIGPSSLLACTFFHCF